MLLRKREGSWRVEVELGGERRGTCGGWKSEAQKEVEGEGEMEEDTENQRGRDGRGGKGEWGYVRAWGIREREVKRSKEREMGGET